MSATINRRKFLTHSAATMGGVAMAGTVVDGLIGAADAAVGVGTGTPNRGGTLVIGVSSDVPDAKKMTGAHGKMDASTFLRAQLVYDTLFFPTKTGAGVLPGLALSATSSNGYKTWDLTLRSGVTFHDGSAFTADDVVANFQAALSDATVGPAIIPILSSVTAVDSTHVRFNMAIGFNALPFWLAEQQVAFIASGKNWNTSDTAAANNAKTNAPLSLSYTGLNGINGPIGTGAFAFDSWTSMDHMNFVANTNYWKKDAKGNSTPYLDAVQTKVIVDPTSRNSALNSGSVDLIYQADGSSINALASMSGVDYRTDKGDKRDPAVNSIILNNTGSLNQWGGWYGNLGSKYVAAIPGVYPYYKRLGYIGAVRAATGASYADAAALADANPTYALPSSAAYTLNAGAGLYVYPDPASSGPYAGLPPVSVLNQVYGWVGGQPGAKLISTDPVTGNAASAYANVAGTPINGRMSSSALQWAPGYFNPMTDPDFRKACAHAINRAIYLKVVDGNVGVKADGPYKSNSKYYNASNGYPGYDKAQAVSHLNTYKANNPGKPVGFVLTTVQGSTASDQAFSWIAGALQAVGISVTQNPRNQVDLISDVINGTYDAAQWSQFGGTHPAQNYVWWNSQNLKDSPTAGGLGFWALPSSYATNGANALNIAGAVNFAHQANPDTENKMLDALTANYSTGADIPYWKGVAGNFGADVNYLWLDATVTAFAARTNVKNWNNALDGGMPGTKSKVVKGVTVTTPTMTYSKMLSTYGGSIRLDQAWMV